MNNLSHPRAVHNLLVPERRACVLKICKPANVAKEDNRCTYDRGHWFRTYFVLARSAAKATASDSNRTTGVFGRRRRSGACCVVVTTGPETTVTMLLSGALTAGLWVSRHDRRLREWTRSMGRSPVSPTVVDYL